MLMRDLDEPHPNRLRDGARILELANKAHFLYLRQNPAEKALNCTIDAANVYPTYRKPFDLIFQAAQTARWWALGDDFRTLPLSQIAAGIPHLREFTLL